MGNKKNLKQRVENLFENDLQKMLLKVINGKKEGLEIVFESLDNEQSEVIAEVLAESSELKEFGLWEVKVPADGLKLIIKVIEKNKSLEKLTIGTNYLTQETVELLAKSLEKNTSIKALSINFYDCTQEVGQSLREMLKKNTSLKVVELNTICYPFEAVPKPKLEVDLSAFLIEVIKENKTLQELNGQSIPLTSQYGNSFAKALESNNSLTTLKLSFGEFSEDFAKGLEKNTGLEVLDVSLDEFREEFVRSFAKMIESNTTLLGIRGITPHDYLDNPDSAKEINGLFGDYLDRNRGYHNEHKKIMEKLSQVKAALAKITHRKNDDKLAIDKELTEIHINFRRIELEYEVLAHEGYGRATNILNEINIIQATIHQTTNRIREFLELYIEYFIDHPHHEVTLQLVDTLLSQNTILPVTQDNCDKWKLILAVLWSSNSQQALAWANKCYESVNRWLTDQKDKPTNLVIQLSLLPNELKKIKEEVDTQLNLTDETNRKQIVKSLLSSIRKSIIIADFKADFKNAFPEISEQEFIRGRFISLARLKPILEDYSVEELEIIDEYRVGEALKLNQQPPTKKTQTIATSSGTAPKQDSGTSLFWSNLENPVPGPAPGANLSEGTGHGLQRRNSIS